MIKKILILLAAIACFETSALATPCATRLQPSFNFNEANSICQKSPPIYSDVNTTFEIVAAGTAVQGDGPLTSARAFHFVTGFDETKVVTLPSCSALTVGQGHFIMNAVTNKFAKIFPASGSQINSLGANLAYTVGVTGNGGRTTLCICQATTQWYCG